MLRLRFEYYIFGVRNFLIQFLVDTARKLGGDVMYDGMYAYLEAKEISITELDIDTEGWDGLESHDPDYDWEGLYKSVLKHGLKQPIVVVPTHVDASVSFKYSIRDGFHRTKLYETMYGADAKIPCYVLLKYGDVYRTKGFNNFDVKKAYYLARKRIQSKTYSPSPEQIRELLENKQDAQPQRKEGDKRFSELFNT